MSAAELIVDDTSALSRLVTTIAAYTRASVTIHTLRLSTARHLRLSTPILVASNAIFRSPLSLFTSLLATTNRLDLMGKTPLQKAQVSSWVEVSRFLPSEEFTVRLEKHMKKREFLVAEKLTLADFVAYGNIGKTYGNDLIRWVTYMQSIPELTSFHHFSPSISQPPPSNKPSTPHFSDPFLPLDLRIGRITHISKHPTKSHLYCEEVDLGGEVRTIASGLVGHVAEADLINSLIVVLTNLKPRKIGDFVSQGMMICAVNGGVIEPLRPAKGAKPGDVVRIAGLESSPLKELPPKKNYWEQVAARLVIAPETGEVRYDQHTLQTSSGAIAAPSLRQGSIS